MQGITMETPSLGLPVGVWAPPHKSAPEPWGRLGWGGCPSGPQFAMGTEVPESLPLPGVEADKGLMVPPWPSRPRSPQVVRVDPSDELYDPEGHCVRVMWCICWGGGP